MAITIKLKNASGSDPSASDLVVGEVALRTDNGKLFTKKDNGSVAEITGGGGIDDGDKGDITVSNSGATFTIDSGVVTTGKLESFSQNRILGRIASGSGDATQLTAANVRTMINVEDGATADQTASEILTLIKTVDGSGSGLDADTLDGISSASFVRSDADDTVSGQLTLTSSSQYPLKINGTHDGKIILQGSNNPYIYFAEGTTNKAYIQWNSSGFFEMLNAESLESIRIGSGTNGLIFREGNNNRTVYHTGNLSVGDGGLTTNNFTDADHNKLNGIESGATADQSNSEIKTAYEANSNTNAFTDALLSKLNGIAASATNVTNTNQLTNGAGFITATLTNEQVQDIVGGMVSGNTESGITVTYQDSDGTLDFSVASQTDQNFTTTLKNKLDGIAAGATNVTNNNQLTNGAGYITSASDNTKMPLAGGEFTGNVICHDLTPDNNNVRGLGSDSKRWANVFTNDLHLSNKGGANKVDGTWGDWTLQEGEDQVFMINNRNGKKYSINLTEIV